MILNEIIAAYFDLAQWAANHYGELILGFRLFLHFVTIAYIVSYVSGRRSRFLPTALAVLIGGCSCAALMQGLVEWKNLVFTTQPWVIGLVFSLTVICVHSKGNMSRPLRLIWR